MRIRRNRVWAALWLMLAGLLVMLPRVASAQPSAGDVYADVKQVIEQLVTREIAQAVTPRMACYSRNGLLKYYPETLQLVYERNLGAVKPVLRDETIEMFANYAFVSLVQQRMIDPGEFLPLENPGTCDANTGCCKEVREAGGPARYAERRAADARADSKPGQARRPDRPLDVCDDMDQVAAPKVGLSCNIVRAALEAAKGNDAASSEFLASAVAVLVYDGMLQNVPLPAGFRQREGPKLFAMLDAHVRARLLDENASVQAELLTLARVNPQQLKPLLDVVWEKFLKESGESLSAAEGDARVVAGAVQLYRDIQWASIDIKKVGEAPRSVALGDLLARIDQASLTPLPGETTGAALARVLLVESGVGPATLIRVTRTGKTLTLEWSPATTPGPALVSGNALGVLLELRRAAVLSSLLRTIFVDSIKDPLLKKLAPLVLTKALALIERVAREWKKFKRASGGKVPVLGFVQALLRDEGRALKLCLKNDKALPAQATSLAVDDVGPVMQPTWCGVVDQLSGLVDREGHVRRMLSAIARQSYKDVAVQALSAMFSTAAREQICCGRGDDCETQVEMYGRFAVSFATYVLSSSSDADGSAAARTAFKEAAYDVLARERTYSGFDWPWGWRLIVPTASLRLSWSNGYVNSGRDGIRYVATLEWLSFMGQLTRTASTYVGLQVSLVDGLGPFSELALRDLDVKYHQQELVFANLFNPRVELLVAAPGLTKRLAIAVGGSVRTASPLAINGDPNDRAYSTWFKASSDAVEPNAGARFLRSIEASIAVKYLP